jgi:hypothetical protein
MADTIETVERFVAVWNQADAERRRSEINNLWTANGRHLMGSQDVQGHDALFERVTASHNASVRDNGRTFRPPTKVQVLPGAAKFRWDMIVVDTGLVVAAGVGFLLLDNNHKIVCDYLFTET